MPPSGAEASATNPIVVPDRTTKESSALNPPASVAVTVIVAAPWPLPANATAVPASRAATAGLELDTA